MHDTVAPIPTPSDDPFGGATPAHYVGPALVALLAVAFLESVMTPMLAVTITAAALAATAVTVTLGHRARDARAAAHLAAKHRWLLEHAGFARTGRVVRTCTRPGEYVRYVQAWQGAQHASGLPDEVFDAILAATLDAGQFDLPYAVTSACHPHIPGGWTTDRDVVDVTGAALRSLLSTGSFTDKDYRAAVRRELHATT